MNRRQSLELSLLGAAAAAITACSRDNTVTTAPPANSANATAGSNGLTAMTTSDREKRRAHALAMFLLVLNVDYRTQAVSNTPQNQLNQASQLRKVRPDVFGPMRDYLTQLKKSIGDTAFNSSLNLIRDFMREAANHKDPHALSVLDDPYTSPDECPCLINNTCPSIEALLAF